MPERRPMIVSPLWLQGSILTFIIGFSILTFSAIRIYQDTRGCLGRSWMRRETSCSQSRRS